MALERNPRCRIDTTFRNGAGRKFPSRRTYMSVNGDGTEDDIDLFMVEYLNLIREVSGYCELKSSFKVDFSFTEIAPNYDTANFLEGAVFIFRIDDPDDMRFWSFLLPGVPLEFFEEDEVTLSMADVSVINLAQFIINNFCTPSNEQFAEFVGGYRGFIRFENQ